jgi:hypothetical protein
MTTQKAAMPASTAQAQPLNSSCCKISPGNPAPISQLSVPPGHSRIAPPAAQPVVFAAVPTRSLAPPLMSPHSLAPAQNALCTFLI